MTVDPAVFLDRDNTIIANDGDLGDASLVRLLEGVPAALKALRDAGFRLVVVTNQGGVARGRYTEVAVDAVHRRIAELVDQATGLERTIERFYYCPFHPEGVVPEYTREHPWRKPQPGMIVQAAADMDLDLTKSFLIGDAPRDTEAGRRAGIRTVLLTRDADRIARAHADFVAGDFAEAAAIVLRKRHDPFVPHDIARTESRQTAATRRVRLRTRDEGAERIRKAVLELTDELRSERNRRRESSPIRFVATALVLASLLTATFAFLNLADLQAFARWGSAAVLALLLAIVALLVDRR